MKRLSTLLTALVATASTAFAQSFEFQYQGRSLDDGATVFIAAEEDDFEELACETNPPSNPNDGLVLKLLDATSANVSATMTVGDNTFLAQVIQWCMGGNCSMMRPFGTLNKTFTMGSIERVQFDAYTIQQEGTLDASLSVTIGGVEKSVNILFFNGDEDGIQSVNGNGGKPMALYSVDGRKLPTAQKGVNIVRMNDGTVKKVLVK